MTLEYLFSASPKKHVIWTESGAFAAAVERPLYFSTTVLPFAQVTA
jgi:hypothetical protein